MLADHGRAMSFLIADGVTPSNEGRGYICRRIIRRAVQHGQRIGLEGVYRLPALVDRADGGGLPELTRARGRDRARRPAEEERFRETLARGMKVFDELAATRAISGEDAFTLATTYGFPIELTQELAEERGQAVDIDRFRALMEGHREVSRAGGESRPSQVAAELVERLAPPDAFVGYEKTDVLTPIGALEPLARASSSCKLAESPFYAAERRPGHRPRLAEARRPRTAPDARSSAEGLPASRTTRCCLIRRRQASSRGDRVKAVDLLVDPPRAWQTTPRRTCSRKALQEVLGDHVRQAGLGGAPRQAALRFHAIRSS